MENFHFQLSSKSEPPTFFALQNKHVLHCEKKFEKFVTTMRRQIIGDTSLWIVLL